LSGVHARVAAVLEALSRAAFDRDVRRIDARSTRMYDWTIVEASYPIFDIVFNHTRATPLRLRLTCTDWDELPPSIELLDEQGKHLGTAPPNVGSVFNGSAHPITGRPFVCMRGAREYHTHFSHTSDLWDNYRGQSGMDLAGIALQLWRAWKRSVG
jgi:hypothetical protein